MSRAAALFWPDFELYNIHSTMIYALLLNIIAAVPPRLKIVAQPAHAVTLDTTGFLTLLCHHQRGGTEGGTAYKRRHDAVYKPSVPPFTLFYK